MADKNSEQSIMDKSMRSVFVGNIPYEATEEKLKEIFSEVGPVLSLKLVFDRESGKPKGFGFCEYKDQETALSAMRNLNGYEIGGRTLRVDNACTEKSRMEMQQLLQGPQVENPYGEPCDPERAPEIITKTVASLPPEQMYELMKQMKRCIQNNPSEARQMLMVNPQLAYALLQAMVVMRIVDPQTALGMLFKANQMPPILGGSGGGSNSERNSMPMPNSMNHHHQQTQPQQQQPPPPAPLSVPNIQQSFNSMPTGDVDLRSLTAAAAGGGGGGNGPIPRINRAFEQDLDMRGMPGPVPPPPVQDPRQRQMPLPPQHPAAGMNAPINPFPSDPRQRQIDPRLRNAAPSGVAMQPPPQQQPPSQPTQQQLQNRIASNYGIPNDASDQEKAALIMQVLQLSEEQIAQLPLEQRSTIFVLKEQISKSTQR